MKQLALKEKERTDFAFQELELLDGKGRDLLEMARVCYRVYLVMVYVNFGDPRKPSFLKKLGF